MKVFVCKVDHKEAAYYVDANVKFGNDIYEEDGCYFIDVLNYNMYVRKFEPNYQILGVDKPYVLISTEDGFVLEQ